jgi:hypothetical protein
MAILDSRTAKKARLRGVRRSCTVVQRIRIKNLEVGELRALAHQNHHYLNSRARENCASHIGPSEA